LIIIERQQYFIKEMKAKATQMAAVLGVSLPAEFQANDNQTGDKTIVVAEDGVYL
jgi:hypothetical protein